jgi:hypothetical protein
MQTDELISCAKCGYDLRGISQDAPCPECGNTHRDENDDVSQGKLMRLIDANIAVKGLEEVPDIRQRTKYWMRIGAMFVFALVFLQFLVMFAIIPIPHYRITLFGMSLFWPSVVVGMMPAIADLSMPPVYRTVRKWIPQSQWCWAIGYVVWFVFYLPTKDVTFGGNIKNCTIVFYIQALGGVGLVGLAFWLHDLALRLGLDLVARRCNIAAFAISTIGVIVFISPWKRIAVDPSDGIAPALYWFYVVVLMFPWYWILIMFGRALLEFSSDSKWSLKYEEDREGRQERITKKREDYEKERGW